MGLYDLTDFIEPYQNAIDSLIDSLGKTVIVHFKPTIVTAIEAESDPIHGGPTKKPSFKPNSVTQTQNTKEIKALIKYSPNDFISFGLKLNIDSNIVRLKTYMNDVPDLIRCEFIVPDSAEDSILGTRFRLLRQPIPIGLGINRYAISFWESL